MDERTAGTRSRHRQTAAEQLVVRYQAIFDQVASAALASLAPPPGGRIHTGLVVDCLPTLPRHPPRVFRYEIDISHYTKQVPRGSQSSVNENASSTNLHAAAVAGGLRRAGGSMYTRKAYATRF